MCYDGTDRKNVNTTNNNTDEAERLSIEVDSSPSSTELLSPPKACLNGRQSKIRSLATSIEMRQGTLPFKPVWLRATQQITCLDDVSHNNSFFFSHLQTAHTNSDQG